MANILDLPRTTVYIDGFNLYYGMREKYGRKYSWLNVHKFSQALTPTYACLVQAKYFTSKIRGFTTDPDKPKRQAQFLRAIKTLDPSVLVIEGKYQAFQSHCKHCNNFVHCPHCGVPHVKPNEKKTDVNIATAMLVDAFEDKCDIQIIVSGDSDYENTLKELRRLFPQKELIIAFPPRRRNNKLIGTDRCTLCFDIAEEVFSESQFEDRIFVPGKRPIEKPKEWI